MLQSLVAYFDTNVYQDIHEGHIPANEVEVLRECVIRNTVKVLLSEDVVEELFIMRDAQRLRELCQTIRTLCPDNTRRGGGKEILQAGIASYVKTPGRNVRARAVPLPLPHDTDLLRHKELRRAAGLDPEQDGDLLDCLMVALRTSGRKQKDIAAVIKRKTAWQDICRKLRPQAQGAFDNEAPQLKEFSRFRQGFLQKQDLAEWANTAMGAICEKTFSFTSAFIREMRQKVQSVRLFLDMVIVHYYSYAINVVGKGKAPVGSDIYDIKHTVFAGAADYFVTNEKPSKKGLRHRYKLVCMVPPDPRCVGLDEFIVTVRRLHAS